METVGVAPAAGAIGRGLLARFEVLKVYRRGRRSGRRRSFVECPCRQDIYPSIADTQLRS